MRIGEIAANVGVSTKTIRYYESIGVLPEPDRDPNGYRSYGASAEERLRFVRDAQATGLTLAEIASILDMRGEGETTCTHVVELLEHHLDELDGHIEALRATRTELAALTGRARAMDPTTCSDPNRCQTITSGDGSTSRVSTTPRGPKAHRH